MSHQDELQRATAILQRISPLKRLDKSVGIGNLAIEAGVSLAAFEEALQNTRHPREGNHVYFGLKSVKAAVKAHEAQKLDELIDERTNELSTLLNQAGRSLRDVATPRQVKPLKTAGKLSFRFTQDEAPALQYGLALTGKSNTSAQVKACVEAYPRLREIENSFAAMTKELKELKEAVNSLPSLILKLSAQQE